MVSPTHIIKNLFENIEEFCLQRFAPGKKKENPSCSEPGKKGPARLKKKK